MYLKETGSSKKGELTDLKKLLANERIHGIDAADPTTTQRLLDLASELKVFTQEELRKRNAFERRLLVLLFVKFIANRVEYCNVKRDRTPVVFRFEMLIPCGLHNIIRVSSTALQNLRKEVNNRKDLTVQQKKLFGEKLEERINASIGSGGNSSFNFTIDNSRVQVVSLTGVKLVQVMRNWSSLVDAVFQGLDSPTDLERKFKWCDLGERFVDVIYLLNFKYDMTTRQIDRFQLCVDLFCSRFRELIGEDMETNYIQNMSAGVFRYYLLSYGSIYAYNNTAMEACAGREQDFFQKGTQHDVEGERGKKLIEAFMDHHMVERAILMDKLAQGTLVVAVNSGKTTKNGIRNEKLKNRRAENKMMQDGNINLMPNRVVRVGEYNAKGVLSYHVVTLQVGDTMPKKAKRCESAQADNTLFHNQLVKNLKA